MHVDAELVERVLEIAAVARESLDQHRAVRIEHDPVGVRGEKVLALRHVARDRDDFLAGRAETVERIAELVQRRQAGAFDFVREQHEPLDARVLGGGVDHAQQIAQLHFPGLLAGKVAERAPRRIDRVLLDDAALRIEHQRRARLQHRTRAEHRREERDQQREKDQVEDEQAREVQRVPHAAQQPDDDAGLILGHGTFLLDVAMRDSHENRPSAPLR